MWTLDQLLQHLFTNMFAWSFSKLRSTLDDGALDNERVPWYVASRYWAHPESKFVDPFYIFLLRICSVPLRSHAAVNHWWLQSTLPNLLCRLTAQCRCNVLLLFALRCFRILSPSSKYVSKHIINTIKLSIRTSKRERCTAHLCTFDCTCVGEFSSSPIAENTCRRFLWSEKMGTDSSPQN